MRHLLTFCQWIVRDYALQTGKEIVVTSSTRMKRCIGKCVRWKHEGKIKYEIRLNLPLLATFTDNVEDIVLHELAHTEATGHGKRFKNCCIRLGIDENHRGAKSKRKNK